jgi:hypothetical protein
VSVLLVTVCVALAMAGIVLETNTRKLRPAPSRLREQGSSAGGWQSTEQQRWIAVLTVPLAAGAVSVTAAIATDARWFFLGAVLLVPAWIAALAYLALSSDVNGRGGESA